MANDENPKPVLGSKVPRFSGPITFMRLPTFEDPAEVNIGLIGVPWDGGTSTKPGARHGPREIRSASSVIRLRHHVSGIAPYELCRVGDLGDAPVNPVDPFITMTHIEDFYKKVHAAGTIPLTAGGDHLSTLPIFRAIAKDEPIGMVHFDAHSDTADTFFGGSKYAHGTPFRRAVEEGLLDPKRTIQIGIRSSLYAPDDLDFALLNGMRIIFIEELMDKGTDFAIQEARRVVGMGKTYISFDVDGIDPAYVPGTGTPEVGGFSVYDAQKMLRGLQGLNLIGGDVVEVSPPLDPTGISALVGANLMFEQLCLLADAFVRRKVKA